MILFYFFIITGYLLFGMALTTLELVLLTNLIQVLNKFKITKVDIYKIWFTKITLKKITVLLLISAPNPFIFYKYIDPIIKDLCGMYNTCHLIALPLY